MRTIAVMNYKGGCGKTTIAVNLSCALSRLDKRVLLVDIDPQSHATVGLGIDSAGLNATTSELLMDPSVRLEDAIVRRTDTLSVIPASTVLSGVEQELAGVDGRERRLAEKLYQIGEDAFDFVLIDCPPSIGVLTFNALIASGEVLIPADASYFSLHGLVNLRETIDLLQDALDHRLHVRVLCNNLETRTRFAREVVAEVEKIHSGVMIDTFISHTVRLKECSARGVSIFDIDERSKVSQQFLSLAQELIEKAPKLKTRDMKAWMERIHGPRKVPEGVLFTLEAPNATFVTVTGDFTNWSWEGIPLVRDPKDGIWKAVIDIEPGRYEYRFIIDGRWSRDPANTQAIRNEFGQENSLLVV
ncbi:MAG: AAA family ATPase [Candidatus Latescibacteria bacterium]|nr:AAA family ATPase [Candidatus Latescibacterota bacterium]NIM22414.1 AAA family ATPase [Candidatus Latescibacterota bacterium]NIM64774.1 AAA family ATPase [Candidatus Latescibacterota bacterium]NIO01285.1 AAA family ATPase [Candidatus Latescibacterota bacterium]NIO27777.1 AAA family ATPase [Candidatus Latescibacterota bacterium]